MRAQHVLLSLALSSTAFGQAFAPAFDVASVKPSQHQAGPDYNNQLTYSTAAFTARNATLQRLLAEAYHLQLKQVTGPSWIGEKEYDIEAQPASAATPEEMALMLRDLLATRFDVKQHNETHETRVYALIAGKSGLKLQPNETGAASASGFHFHGDLRQLADLLTVQLSIPAATNRSEPVRASSSPIPVIDRTGLAGTFDFTVDIRPELGTDMFALWQRALQDQLGLKIISRKEALTILVVKDALQNPTPN
jgi:uncharacterized protein (TIGR03435 family)